MDGPTDIALLVESCVCGDASRSDALDLLRMGSGMWMRTAFSPGHFTASGFVASPDGTRLLLVWHAKLGRWIQPGGHFEQDDAGVEAAIRREVAEETGLVMMEPVGPGLLRIDAHRIPPHADEPAHVHVDLAMGFVAGEESLGHGDASMAVRWVPFDVLGDEGADAAVLASGERLAAMIAHRRS